MSADHLKSVPDEDVDPNIRGLVQSLNSITGIATLESCGGHATPSGPGQRPEGEWYVVFRAARNTEGWAALEFLTWAINGRTEFQGCAQIVVSSRSTRGDMYFALEGQTDPDRLAAWLVQAKEQYQNWSSRA